MRKRLQHFLESLASVVLVYSGLWFVLQQLRRPRIVILAYHRILPDQDERRWAYPERCVSASTLERQLLALKRSYTFISLEELDATLAGEKRLDRSVALVTFDDGYRDVYERALPILQRHGIPALCFLSLGFVEARRSFWFDRLAQGLETWDREPQRRARLRPLLPAALAAAFEKRATRAERLQRAVAFLVRLPVRERRALMKRLMPELLPTPAQASAEALTWREVRELREQGVAMGAHGCTHTQLTRLSLEEAWREVQESVHGVARGSGAAVEAFAYPHGAVDDDVARWVAEAGVRLAFTLEPRPNHPGDDPMRLGRRNVCEGSSRGLRGRFSAARFLCEVSGLLPATASTRRSSRARGAAQVDLTWTGPQEASARLEPAGRVSALPGGELRSSDSPERRSSWTGPASPR